MADNFITNIQAWTVHGSFEFSGKMQTIEIYTPNRHERPKEADLFDLE